MITACKQVMLQQFGILQEGGLVFTRLVTSDVDRNLDVVQQGARIHRGKMIAKGKDIRGEHEWDA